MIIKHPPFINFSTQRYPESVSRWKQLQKTNYPFETSVYRKATNADIVLHYDSNSSARHTRSCVIALFNRITTHCSNAEARNQGRNYLHRLFDSNGHPLNFINRTLRHRNSQPPSITNGETVPSTWRALPYAKKGVRTDCPTSSPPQFYRSS